MVFLVKTHLNRFLVLPGIIATFVGTVIGAGFASGREIYQFFSVYGWWGFFGILLALLILGFAGVRVCQIGVLLKPNSYQELLEYLLGKRLAVVMDFLLGCFFLILVGIMLAGSGSIFVMFNLDFWNGVCLTGLILILVLWQGLPGLILANLLIIPLMFLFTLLISLFGIFHGEDSNLSVNMINNDWIISALQFASYNLVLAIPVLLALAKRYRNCRILSWGSWLGSLLLGIMTVLVNLVIHAHFKDVQSSSMPMLEISKLMGNLGFIIYGLILWGEIFSTLLANVYGLAERLLCLTGLSMRFWIVILVGVGILLAGWGFKELIAFFYPIFGWICLVIIILLCVKNPVESS